MFARSDKEEEVSENPEWAKRVDRLLAGNMSQQVGTALEAMARDVAALAERADQLGELRDELARLSAEAAGRAASPSGPDHEDLAASISMLEERLKSLETGLPKIDDVLEAVREATPPPVDSTAHLSRLEAAITQVAEGVASLERGAAPAPTPEQVAEIIERRIEATEQRLDNLGRQIGGALGRLRVQNDEIMDLAGKMPAFADTVGERVGALEAELRTTIEAMASAIDGRLALVPAAEKIAQQLAEEIARHQEASDKRVESNAQQIASVAARAKAALETFGTQLTAVGQRVEGIADLREELARMRAGLDGITESIAASMASAVEAAAQPVSDRLTVVEQRMGSLPSRESLEALRDRLLRETGERSDRLAREVSQRLDALAASMQGLATPESIAGALREEREASDRRAEDLGRQIAAVVGSVISSIDELRSQVNAIEERPDVPPALREELARLLDDGMSPATERLRLIEQQTRSMPTPESFAQALEPVVGELAASLRAHVDERTGAMRARIDETAGSVGESIERLASSSKAQTESVRRALDEAAARATASAAALAEDAKAATAGAADRLLERMSALGERVGALPDGESLFAMVRDLREFEESIRKERTEQTSTMSASVGAIYLRVRSLEQAMAAFKNLSEKEVEDSRMQLASLIERMAEVATLEKRLAKEIAAIQDLVRERGAERERDREIMAVLVEIAEAAQKHDRSGLAERLRSLIGRGKGEQEEAPAAPQFVTGAVPMSPTEANAVITVDLDAAADGHVAKNSSKKRAPAKTKADAEPVD